MRSDQVRMIMNMPCRFMKSFVIRWQVTSLCNYQCDFCIQGSREAHLAAAKGESLERRKEITANLVKYIETKVSGRNTVELYLIGGEVTILKDFKEIVSAFVNCSFKGHIIIYLTTNLSREGDTYAGLCELFKGKRNRSFNISASYYREYVSPEEFTHKVDGLKGYLSKRSWANHLVSIKIASLFRLPAFLKNGANVFLTIGVPVLDDASWDLWGKFRSVYHKSAVHVNQIIIREYKTNLSDKVKERLKSAGGSTKKLRVTFSNGESRYFKNMQQLGISLEDAGGRFSPLGFRCDAGERCFSVSSDGAVWRCPVLSDSSISNKWNSLGDIKNIGSSLLSSPAVCGADHCSCNYFTTIWHD